MKRKDEFAYSIPVDLNPWDPRPFSRKIRYCDIYSGINRVTRPIKEVALTQPMWISARKQIEERLQTEFYTVSYDKGFPINMFYNWSFPYRLIKVIVFSDFTVLVSRETIDRDDIGEIQGDWYRFNIDV